MLLAVARVQTLEANPVDPVKELVEKMDLNDKIAKAMRARRLRKWTPMPEVLLWQGMPRALCGFAPRVLLGQKWWDTTRKAAYRSTLYHCQACQVYKYDAKGRQWLEGHEVYDVDYLLGTMEYIKTIPLCHFCHNFVHLGRLACQLDEGLVHHSKYAAIVQHGERVLDVAGLNKLGKIYEGPVADDEDWVLIIDGKEYKPKPPKKKTKKRKKHA